MDQSAQEIRKLLIKQDEEKKETEKMRLMIEDIKDVVVMSEKDNFALIKVKKDKREQKYHNH